MAGQSPLGAIRRHTYDGTHTHTDTQTGRVALITVARALLLALLYTCLSALLSLLLLIMIAAAAVVQ